MDAMSALQARSLFSSQTVGCGDSNDTALKFVPLKMCHCHQYEMQARCPLPQLVFTAWLVRHLLNSACVEGISREVFGP